MLGSAWGTTVWPEMRLRNCLSCSGEAAVPISSSSEPRSKYCLSSTTGWDCEYPVKSGADIADPLLVPRTLADKRSASSRKALAFTVLGISASKSTLSLGFSAWGAFVFAISSWVARAKAPAPARAPAANAPFAAPRRTRPKPPPLRRMLYTCGAIAIRPAGVLGMGCPVIRE